MSVLVIWYMVSIRLFQRVNNSFPIYTQILHTENIDKYQGRGIIREAIEECKAFDVHDWGNSQSSKFSAKKGGGWLGARPHSRLKSPDTSAKRLESRSISHNLYYL